jgi:hypothetical protein
MTLLGDFSSHDLLGPATQADAQNRKELSQIPMSRVTSLFGVRASKLNRSSTRVEMIFSWTMEHGRHMKSRWDHTDMAQKWTMLSWVLDRPWWLTSAIRAPGRTQEGTYEDTSIAIRTDVHLDNSDRNVLEVTCEIKTTWLEGGPTLGRVLVRDRWCTSTNRE